MQQLETEIADLLSDLTHVQEELLEVLTLKRDCMAAADAPGMVALQDREQQLGNRLQDCHDRRSTMLKQAGSCGLPDDSIGQLASAVTKTRQGPLNQQIRAANARTRLLRHQSLTNWVLAQRTLLHLSQLLEIIATGGRLQPTYGKRDPVNSRGALVDQEA